jgi:hypothetical protein
MSLKECMVQIMDLIQKRYTSARDMRCKNETFIATSQSYPELSAWPLSYQLLVGAKITKAERLISDGSWKYQWFQASLQYTCRCKFYETHQLPCKHLFIKDMNCNKKWFRQENSNAWTIL